MALRGVIYMDVGGFNGLIKWGVAGKKDDFSGGM